MSHFSVLVIGDNVEEQLLPYHEFECTGYEKDIEEIDVTESEFGYLFELGSSYIDELKNLNVTNINELKKFNLSDEKTLINRAIAKGIEICNYENNIIREDDISNLDIEKNHKFFYIVVDNDNVPIKYIQRTNPNYKWDWYVIGGRWSNIIKLKNSDEYVNRALKGNIDFDYMIKSAADEAYNEYNTVKNIFNGKIPKLDVTWDFLMKQVDDNVFTYDKAREIYNSQSAIIKLNSVKEKFNEIGMYLINIDKYQISLDEYVENAKKYAFNTFSYVLNGKWHENGEMGWFASVTNKNTSDDEWCEHYMKMLKDIPDDTLLTIVDCHI